MKRAFIKIRFPSEETAKIIFEAVKPETTSPPTARSKVEIELEGKGIKLTIDAKDTTALRAAVNAYLRWTSSSQKVLEVLESFNMQAMRKSN